MRLCDVLNCVPGLLFALAVVAALGSSMRNLLIAVTIVSLPGFIDVYKRQGMGDTKYLNGKGRRNYLVCMVIMYAMILFYVLKIVIGVVNSVYVAGTPQEEVKVEFNGYEYRYDFPFVCLLYTSFASGIKLAIDWYKENLK